MEAKEFNNLDVTNQYGQKVTIIEINGNIATTGKGMNNLYHTTKLFYQGKSVFRWLNENEKN